ncbi:hypothetical protein [Hymenobacter sp.]|uniref:hypothetical protein n=1 Tax=Hymenobacter sp. TaxID=1898978 RepID=UPI00286A3F9C|nr:hypothetical protein [Hymenobacter sp.]
MKHMVAIVGLSMSPVFVYGQNCDVIKAENKKLKAEIAFLKGSTTTASSAGFSGIYAPQIQTSNDIDFELQSAIGDKKTQLVTVVIKFTNKAANKEGFITPIENFSSSEGEEFALKGGFGGYRTLATDAPLRGTYVFGDVLPKITTIKMLRVPFEFKQANYKRHQVEFRDVTINWK